MKKVIVIIILFITSCNDKSDLSDSNSLTNSLIDSKQQSYVNTYGFQNNFEALLESNKLYYLEHMSVDYDNESSDFWDYKDTILVNNTIIKRLRKGECTSMSLSDSTLFCLEHQTHTINTKLNYVVRFEGSGSGYFTDVKFYYNNLNRLIKYEEINKFFELEYTRSGDLKFVLQYKIVDGKEVLKSRIMFKNFGIK